MGAERANDSHGSWVTRKSLGTLAHNVLGAVSHGRHLAPFHPLCLGVKSAVTPDSQTSLVQCLEKKPEARAILTGLSTEVLGLGIPGSS